MLERCFLVHLLGFDTAYTHVCVSVSGCASGVCVLRVEPT